MGFLYLEKLISQPYDYIRHLEIDRHVAGNILFIDATKAQTTNGSDTHVIVGGTRGYREGVGQNAYLNDMHGFSQINSTHVLLADTLNHCLRFLNRVTEETSHYLGTCQSSGFVDGEEPKFNKPWAVVQDPSHSSIIYLTDSDNHALRMINMADAVCSTVISKKLRGIFYPKGLSLDWRKKKLLIANDHFISSVDVQNYDIDVIAGTSSSTFGFKDADTKNSMFSDPHGVISLSENITVIADHDNYRIRVVDLIQKNVYSICSGYPSTEEGDVAACGLMNPNDLLYWNSYLYVAGDGITRMKGRVNRLQMILIG